MNQANTVLKKILLVCTSLPVKLASFPQSVRLPIAHDPDFLNMKLLKLFLSLLLANWILDTQGCLAEETSFPDLILCLVKSGYSVNYDITAQLSNLRVEAIGSSPDELLRNCSSRLGFNYNVVGHKIEIVDRRILEQGNGVPSNRKMFSVAIQNKPLDQAVRTLDLSFCTNSFSTSPKLRFVSLRQEGETTIREVIWKLVNQTGQCAGIVTSPVEKGYHSIFGNNICFVVAFAPLQD